MKKNYRLVSILMASFMGVVLLGFPAFGQEIGTEELIQDSIQVYSTQYQEEKVVDKGYLVRKGVLNSTESTELDEEIACALDVGEPGSAMYKQICSMLAQGDRLILSSKYLKYDETSGETIPVSKDEALIKSKLANDKRDAELMKSMYHSSVNTKALSTRSLVGDTTEKFSSDGYMKLTIGYLGNSDTATYVFGGMAEWLSMPSKRSEDAVSLQCSLLSWRNDEYSAEVEYDEEIYSAVNNSTTTEHKDYYLDPNSVQVPEGGFYFTHRLPADCVSSTYWMKYSNYTITINGGGVLTQPTVTKNFNVYMNYSHTTKSLLDISLSWSFGPIGVSLNENLFTEGTDYSHQIQITR